MVSRTPAPPAPPTPVRRSLQRVGGSHAQRDVLQRTLLESALRIDELDLARALLAERLSLRETSVYGWTQRARLEKARGWDAAAEAAQKMAATHRRRFTS